jgi:hypothetical protein
MTYNFYAAKTDKLKILDYIFRETDLHVFDLYSASGEEICAYKSADQIAAKYDLENGSNFAVTFQLWTPRHKGKPVFRKIELDPKRCKEDTFRYSTNGWGMIQLYFGGVKNNLLHPSHIGHFNEKGASQKEGANNVNGTVSEWDWKEIQATANKLKYHIHKKLALSKIGTIDLLSGAEELIKQGITLSLA